MIQRLWICNTESQQPLTQKHCKQGDSFKNSSILCFDNPWSGFSLTYYFEAAPYRPWNKGKQEFRKACCIKDGIAKSSQAELVLALRKCLFQFGRPYDFVHHDVRAGRIPDCLVNYSRIPHVLVYPLAPDTRRLSSKSFGTKAFFECLRKVYCYSSIGC